MLSLTLTEGETVLIMRRRCGLTLKEAAALCGVGVKSLQLVEAEAGYAVSLKLRAQMMEALTGRLQAAGGCNHGNGINSEKGRSVNSGEAGGGVCTSCNDSAGCYQQIAAGDEPAPVAAGVPVWVYQDHEDHHGGDVSAAGGGAG